jgi:hypothetical protein
MFFITIHKIIKKKLRVYVNFIIILYSIDTYNNKYNNIHYFREMDILDPLSHENTKENYNILLNLI